MEKHKKCNKILLVFMCLMWDSATNRPIQDGYRICTLPPLQMQTQIDLFKMMTYAYNVFASSFARKVTSYWLSRHFHFPVHCFTAVHTAPGPPKVRVHAP